MSKLIKVALTCGLAMLAITPAVGQTGNAAQTPENAHKFLRSALIGSKFGATPFTETDSTGCVTNMYHWYAGAYWTYSVDWSLARGLTVNGSVIDIAGVMTNYTNSWRRPMAIEKPQIDLGTSEMATRVQKAMEVLRVSCDKTQGMGF